MSGRRLPTLHPTWTDDEGEYIYKWELLGNRLAALLGGTLKTFDPDFILVFPADSHGFIRCEHISLPTTLRILDLVLFNEMSK